MDVFDFQPRTRVVFGENKIDALGELAREAGGTRALVVSDAGIIAAAVKLYAKEIEPYRRMAKKWLIDNGFIEIAGELPDPQA